MLCWSHEIFDYTKCNVLRHDDISPLIANEQDIIKLSWSEIVQFEVAQVFHQDNLKTYNKFALDFRKKMLVFTQCMLLELLNFVFNFQMRGQASFHKCLISCYVNWLVLTMTDTTFKMLFSKFNLSCNINVFVSIFAVPFFFSSIN